jgi:hypothetical protein
MLVYLLYLLLILFVFTADDGWICLLETVSINGNLARGKESSGNDSSTQRETRPKSPRWQDDSSSSFLSKMVLIAVDSMRKESSKKRGE